jgi:hypothetical protein
MEYQIGDTIVVAIPRPFKPINPNPILGYDPEWPDVEWYDYKRILITPELVAQYGFDETN